MEQLIISNTIKNVKKSFIDFKLDHNGFMTELAKYQGVIAGSFMFMNFAFVDSGKNFLGGEFECNDIDVYIPYHNSLLESDYMDNYYHPFEKYIMNCITDKVLMSESYMFTDGVVLSRTYKAEKIDINVILISGPVVPFINENFDLDCCKIIYDGTTCRVHNINDLVQGITKCTYNKCTLNHIYKNRNMYMPKNSKHCGDVHKSEAFNKFRMLFQTYLDVANNEYSDFNPQYESYMKYISLQYNLDKIFGNLTMLDIDNIELTDDIVKIISMIRTHERINKYKKRGITEVKLNIGTIRV